VTRVVAIHGFLGCDSDWQGIAGFLPSNVQFEKVNLFSKLPETLCGSISLWAQEFNNYHSRKPADRRLLIGYSMGGRLALEAAMQRPDLWAQVAIVAGHPGLVSVDEKQARAQLDAKWAQQFMTLPWDEVIKLWGSQPVFANSYEPERLEANYSRGALCHALTQWSLATQELDAVRLKSLQKKIVWYVGQNDKKYVELYRQLAGDGLIDNIREVPGAGHRVIFDQPKELARQLVLDLKL
jgi:2-succinyl-6-hydroxy-2,4-cyclohexadiene-1-carboxylate synthase